MRDQEHSLGFMFFCKQSLCQELLNSFIGVSDRFGYESLKTDSVPSRKSHSSMSVFMLWRRNGEGLAGR